MEDLLRMLSRFEDFMDKQKIRDESCKTCYARFQESFHDDLQWSNNAESSATEATSDGMRRAPSSSSAGSQSFTTPDALNDQQRRYMSKEEFIQDCKVRHQELVRNPPGKEKNKIHSAKTPIPRKGVRLEDKKEEFTYDNDADISYSRKRNDDDDSPISRRPILLSRSQVEASQGTTQHH